MADNEQPTPDVADWGTRLRDAQAAHDAEQTDSRTRRDRLVYAAHTAGLTPYRIAQATGLSQPGVAKIIDRQRKGPVAPTVSPATVTGHAAQLVQLAAAVAQAAEARTGGAVAAVLRTAAHQAIADARHAIAPAHDAIDALDDQEARATLLAAAVDVQDRIDRLHDTLDMLDEAGEA